MPDYSRLMPAAGLLLVGCAADDPSAMRPEPCTEPWYAFVESQVPSGDGMGHGPDVGSGEWQSVIEFKLGVRGNSDVPDRASPDWCVFIDERV